MRKGINVFSEIGELKSILLHRPGVETNRIDTSLFEYMLFDDIMDYEVAQKEHDKFVETFKNQGVEVFYLEELVSEIFENKKILEQFVKDYLNESNIKDKNTYNACYKYILSFKKPREVVDRLIMGIKTNEVKIKDNHSLSMHFHLKTNHPFFVDPIPNILFQRDPVASIYNSFNIHNMSKSVRKKETLFHDYLFRYHPFFKNVHLTYKRSEPYTMEGGDILVISEKILFIAVSERTQPEAIELLSIRLFQKYPKLEKVVVIDIPKSHATMHLDTILTQVDHDVFIMDTEMHNIDYEVCILTSKDKKSLQIKIIEGKMKEILPRLLGRDVRIVLTGDGDPLRSSREQWTDGANAITIRPGTVIAYTRNKYTIKALKREGIKVLEIPDSELSRGRGGPRCMGMPLWRNEL